VFFQHFSIRGEAWVPRSVASFTTGGSSDPQSIYHVAGAGICVLYLSDIIFRDLSS